MKHSNTNRERDHNRRNKGKVRIKKRRKKESRKKIFMQTGKVQIKQNSLRQNVRLRVREGDRQLWRELMFVKGNTKWQSEYSMSGLD